MRPFFLGKHVRLLAGAIAGLATACTQPQPVQERTHTETAAALPEEPNAVPISLTASDGTGLRLVRLDVRGAVQAPLAFTELHMTFENPEDRVLEGRFAIDLPPKSALSRFAMKLDDHLGSRWQEGEVVERMKARTTYEAYLHNNVDPALLEKQAGNRFSAKVFPIPAGARKELIISYSQTMQTPGAPYHLPLRGLPRLDQLNAVFFVDEPAPNSSQSQRRVVSLHETDYKATEDFAIETTKAPATTGLRHKTTALARVQVQGETDVVPLNDVTFAFDSSASRALGYGHKVQRFRELVRRLASQRPDTRIRVIAFDQEVQSIFSGLATEFGLQHAEALLARQALGASDLGGLFDALRRSEAPPRRLVLVTDGINTAGPREIAQLREGLHELRSQGLQRLDAIVDTVLGDQNTLDALVTADLPNTGVVSGAHLDPATLLRRIGRNVLPPMEVTVPQATQSWPKTIEGLQPGDTALVYAELPADAPMRVVLGGETPSETDVPLMQVPAPLLSRALSSARIDELTVAHSSATDRDTREQIRRQIIKTSTRARVVSDFTAMLVLESDRDYYRFGIDSTAKLDILTVGPEGVRLTPHARDLAPTPTPKPQRSGFAMRQPDSSSAASRHSGEEGRMGRRAQSGLDSNNILELIAQGSGHFLASPDGEAFAVGDDDQDIWGGLLGTEVGEAFGVGGVGLRGTGRGGGGTGEGVIGLGNTGLIGAGVGSRVDADRNAGAQSPPSEAGYGSGTRSNSYGLESPARRQWSGRRSPVPRVRQKKLRVSGALGRDIVRRIIRAHINEVRGCYNRGLLRDEDLQGVVTVRFQVTATGNVSSAVVHESSLSDGSVASCVTRAVRRWRFPKPRRNTATVIAPFALRPGTVRVRAPRTPSTTRQATPPPLAPASIAPPESLAAVDAEVTTAYSGEMQAIKESLEAGDTTGALAMAIRWRRGAPTDVMALLALGERYRLKASEIAPLEHTVLWSICFPPTHRCAGTRGHGCSPSGRRVFSSPSIHCKRR